MLKALTTICAVTLFSMAAVAQQGSAPPPPSGPTQVQCQEGHKQGMQWTKQQFETACLKFKESNKN